jgi:L-serine deaminase
MAIGRIARMLAMTPSRNARVTSLSGLTGEFKIDWSEFGSSASGENPEQTARGGAVVLGQTATAAGQMPAALEALAIESEATLAFTVPWRTSFALRKSPQARHSLGCQ